MAARRAAHGIDRDRATHLPVARVASTSRIVQLRQEEAELQARLAPLLDERGLLPEHWRIIAVVDDHPGSTMATVAASAVVPAATLTRHVDKLAEIGIVVRHIDPDDRRRVVVTLSPQGRQYAARLRAAEAAVPARRPGRSRNAFRPGDR